MSKKTSEKKCTKCGILKGLDEYYPRGNKYLRSDCKECTRAHINSTYSYDKEYHYNHYQNNKEKIQARRKEIRQTSIDQKVKHLLRNCKQRSKKIGFEFDLDYEYVLKLYKEQNGKCALSDEQLEISGDRLSNMLSLDRIDSSKGYIKGNVQWVCIKYNIMKVNADMEQFIEMCRAVVRKAGP